MGVKYDGTMWGWGTPQYGDLGVNNRTYYSSPRQIPGTTWRHVRSTTYGAAALKTDGTLWTWGRGNWGSGAYNLSGPNVHRSSPVQVPGTTWNNIFAGGSYHYLASKTDGTGWAWGDNQQGELGHNRRSVSISSPVQVGSATNYVSIAASGGRFWTFRKPVSMV